eukprot:Skav217579  [mRNA]  locus=scaffold129:196885:201369:- [translate_table: standard]
MPTTAFWYYDYLKEKKEAELRAITTQDDHLGGQSVILFKGKLNMLHMFHLTLSVESLAIDTFKARNGLLSINPHSRNESAYLVLVVLLSLKGKVVTEKDFLGQCSTHMLYLLIYFGFTFCPDICPQDEPAETSSNKTKEMEKQSRAIELLDEEPQPKKAMIAAWSVDPKRDKPALVDDYCKDFHPRIVGLTGTPEQVKKVRTDLPPERHHHRCAYRVYYNEGLKTDDEARGLPSEDYLVDHSIIHYFVGKNGKFIDFFGKNMTAKDQEKRKERKQRRGVDSTEEEVPRQECVGSP